MNAPESNPYLPPTEVAPDDQLAAAKIVSDDKPYVRSTLQATAARWFLVCGISAIPSFLFGLAITNGEAVGMLTGVFIFAVGYTLLDYATADQAWRAKKLVRGTLRFTYGTRIAVSILFPVGAYLDIMCGAASISIVGFFFGEYAWDGRGSGGMDFAGALLMTLVQGCVLNGVLAIYGVLILGINWIIVALKT